MKRTIAALVVLLMLLTGCAAKEPAAVVPTAAPPQEFELTDGTLQRRDDVQTLVIGAVAYDGEGNSRFSSLSLLVKSGTGEVSMLTIPKDTRVWVEEYDEGVYQYCRYGAISEVYHAAESAGLGEKKTMEAVASLLGGVRLDHYILLNVVQLEKLAELVGSVMVDSEDPIPEHQIPAGFQNIAPKISEYASYSYLNSLGGVEYSGTDPYKLQRHQQLIETMLGIFARKTERLEAEAQTLYAEEILSCVTTDMSSEQLLEWIGSGVPEFTDVGILKGTQNERRSESYWISDRSAVKEWVIEKFYLSDEEE